MSQMKANSFFNSARVGIALPPINVEKLGEGSVPQTMQEIVESSEDGLEQFRAMQEMNATLQTPSAHLDAHITGDLPIHDGY